jgi:uncharacterized protein YicC (UPF0701 family)
VETFEPGRIKKVRKALFHNSVKITGRKHGQEQVRAGADLYLENFDINEEKVRLKKHCEYFLETIETPAQTVRC